MDQTQRHEMVLEKTYSSGADEWYCPTCGRRLLMDYGPTFKRTVLDAGDEYAVHSGGKGGLRIGSVKVAAIHETTSQDEKMLSLDDPSLAPWVAWLNKVGFESFWNDDA